MGKCWLAFCAAALVWQSGAAAHEMWLEPTRAAIEPGAVYEIEIRIGQNLSGPDYSYLPNWFDRFQIIEADVARPVDSFIGDLPAVSETAGAAGLLTLVYLSTADIVDYPTLEKFLVFTEKEGLDGAAERHRARSLPDADIRETYVRSAKALVKAGDGAGQDRARGLPFEFVAEANPFTAPPGASIPVRLYWQGDPQANVQVSIFRRDAEEQVTVERVRTDAEGRVQVPGAPGFYLLSAVRLDEPPAKLAADKNADWHTVWAALTYHRP